MRFHLLTVHCQCSTTWMPSRDHLPSDPECICYPRSRRRISGRGILNSVTQWWTLGYGRNPWQTFMYSWTFLTIWTMPIPMSIFGLPGIIILWYIGFKWHLQVQRSDDCIQWWRHPCTQWYWILERLWLEMNIYIHMNSRHLNYFVSLSRLDIFMTFSIITTFAFIWPHSTTLVWHLQLCKLHIMLYLIHG